MRLEGKSTIVTGANGGIGRAVARRFLNEGANITLVDLDKNQLNEFLASLSDERDKAIAIEADVSKSADVQNYVNAAMDAFGRVDTLFNNAGIEGSISSLEDYDENTFFAGEGCKLVLDSIKSVSNLISYEHPSALELLNIAKDRLTNNETVTSEKILPVYLTEESEWSKS